MHDELRHLFAVRLARGALLSGDGTGVALVIGGAPSSELLAAADRARAAEDYHRLLLTLVAPLHIYHVDARPDHEAELTALDLRQRQALDDGRELHAAVIHEMATYVRRAGSASSGRGREVIWASAVTPAVSVETGDLFNQLRAVFRQPAPVETPRQRAQLDTASEYARRLAEALAVLDGSPPPRPMEAEEIAALLYRLADPQRAQHFALPGPLLARVRRVVQP